MKKMHNFTRVRLPGTVNNPDYVQAIEAVRKWAGPNVYLGDAGLLTPEQEDHLPLFQRLADRALDLCLSVDELAGSKITYTATVPEDLGYSGSLEVTMLANEAGEVWVTSISVIGAVPEITPETEREIPAHIQIRRSQWRFKLSPNARSLAAGLMLAERGVEHEIDTDSLIDQIYRGIIRSRA